MLIYSIKNRDFFSQFIEKEDYEAFLKDELQNRGNLYPPNVRLARVIFSHQNWIKGKEYADFYAKQIIYFHPNIELVGFKECDIFKIANKYRYEILIRSKDIKKMLEFLHSIDNPYAIIDMDTVQ